MLSTFVRNILNLLARPKGFEPLAKSLEVLLLLRPTYTL